MIMSGSFNELKENIISQSFQPSFNIKPTQSPRVGRVCLKNWTRGRRGFYSGGR